MNEKYEKMFLVYIYELLELKKYEKNLKAQGIEKIEFTENVDLFEYFSLLNTGEFNLFNEEEKKEFAFLSCYELKDLISNNEIKQNFIEYMKKTYKKYFFFDVTGEEYVYYGNFSDEYMAPDDAIALGLNYKKFVGEKANEDYDITLDKQDDIICDTINDIQYNKGPQKNIKVAVIKRNEKILSNHSIIF